MVSSEVQPFSLTGGLGIVVRDLSAALVRAGVTCVLVGVCERGCVILMERLAAEPP